MSPGTNFTEDSFIGKLSEDTYLLPEYVTGLLLSQNINLEFVGISASQSVHAVHSASSSSYSLSGGFGPWKASVSYGRSSSNYQKTFKAESTSSGMRISIPGAQIIGYYTQVMPKFPL